MKVGRIQIQPEIILQWLDYVGGRITGIGFNSDYAEIIELVIEHPDMPEVKDCGVIPIIKPIYTRTQDSMGHFVVLRQK